MGPFEKFPGLVGIEMSLHVEKVVEGELLEFELQTTDAEQRGGEFRAFATVVLNGVGEIMPGTGKCLGESRALVMECGLGRPESIFLLGPQVELLMKPLMKVSLRRSGMAMSACLFPM